MKKILTSFFVLFLTGGLVACASNTRNMNTGVGAVSGAAVATLTGNPIIVLGGAVVGGTIGHSMNSADKTQK